MKSSQSKVYRYPRKEQVKLFVQCAMGFVAGGTLLLAPIGLFRWVAILPLGYSLFTWNQIVRPKRAFVIRANEKQLKIGSKTYDWDQFDHMDLDRSEGKSRIRLSGLKGKIDTGFDSDLPGYLELAQECLFHLNRPIEKKEPTAPPDAMSSRKPTSKF